MQLLLYILRIVDLNARNKCVGTLTLHVEMILKQFQTYLICDLQDMRRRACTYSHSR